MGLEEGSRRCRSTQPRATVTQQNWFQVLATVPRPRWPAAQNTPGVIHGPALASKQSSHLTTRAELLGGPYVTTGPAWRLCPIPCTPRRERPAGAIAGMRLLTNQDLRSGIMPDRRVYLAPFARCPRRETRNMGTGEAGQGRAVGDYDGRPAESVARDHGRAGGGSCPASEMCGRWAPRLTRLAPRTLCVDHLRAAGSWTRNHMNRREIL